MAMWVNRYWRVGVLIRTYNVRKISVATFLDLSSPVGKPDSVYAIATCNLSDSTNHLEGPIASCYSNLK
jgi:hypothetical protein